MEMFYLVGRSLNLSDGKRFIAHSPGFKLTNRNVSPRLLVNFRNKLIFYGEELLAPRPTPKLVDNPLSAVPECLFNIFAATLHIWKPSPPSAT
jgi:hypothetical protein